MSLGLREKRNLIHSIGCNIRGEDGDLWPAVEVGMFVMGLRGRGGRPEVQMSSIGFWVRGRRVEEDAAREALMWWAMLWEMQWGSMPTLEGGGVGGGCG